MSLASAAGDVGGEPLSAVDRGEIRHRVEEIGNFVSAGDPERARKILLDLVRDYRTLLPAQTYSAVMTKSGEIAEANREVEAGFGDRELLGRLRYQMVSMAERILDAIDEKSAAAPLRDAVAIATGKPAGDPPSGLIISFPERMPDRPVEDVEPPPGQPAQAVEPPPEAPEARQDKRSRAPPILVVEGISKSYGAKDFSLKEVSFSLRVGEITAVVGRNGSGKSTLMSIVLGMLDPDSGRLNYPLHRGDPSQLSYGYVQQRPPAWRGPLRENLEFIAAAHGIRGRRNVDRIDWLLDRFDLAGKENRYWRELSGGYQLRYELAKALVHEPQLVVLDEPLAHLDLLSQEDLLWDLKTLATSKQSSAVLITSQHLFEMEQIADQLVVLQEGQATFIGETKDVNRERSYSRFEVATGVGRPRLAALLGDMAVRIVETNGIFQIDTAVTIGSTRLLAVLEPIGITYFRDISTSTKSMMIDRAKSVPTRVEAPAAGDGP